MDDQTPTTEEPITVEPTDDQVPSSGNNDAVLLLRIEEMIKTHIGQIDTLQEQITKFKEMVDDIFGNDETFQEHDKIAKEAAKVRSKTKSEIMKRSDVADLGQKIKSLKSEKAELQGGLSDYLREYQRLSGSNEIEGDDGQVREIIYTAKLVKKSAFRP